jgi:diguanylate cyclase (GGDEF)-like protein
LRKLREQLSVLREEAAKNESIFRKLMERELRLLKTSSLSELLTEMINGLADSYGLRAVSLILWDPQHELRHLLMSEHRSPEQLAGVHFVDHLYGLAPQYTHLHKPWLGPFTGCDHQLLFPGASEGIRSVALIPLRRQETLVGVINFGSGEEKRFTRHHGTDFLEHLGLVASFALENAANRARLMRSGTTDVLTGWHNRRYLMTRMQEELVRAQRESSWVTCLFLDLDFFKSVNDAHGHLAGDRVLREVAQRIEEQVRGSDVAARYGGEEFVVLLPNTRPRDAMHLAERIRGVVASTPIEVSPEHALTVTVSIGIAGIRPEKGKGDLKSLCEGLIRQADVALYQAKADGRNCVRAAA